MCTYLHIGISHILPCEGVLTIAHMICSVQCRNGGLSKPTFNFENSFKKSLSASKAMGSVFEFVACWDDSLKPLLKQ